MRAVALVLLPCLACAEHGPQLRPNCRSLDGNAVTSSSDRGCATRNSRAWLRLVPYRAGKSTANADTTSAGKDSAYSISPFSARLLPPIDPGAPIAWGKEQLRRLLEGDSVRHLTAGGAAGVVSTTVLAPLEAVRINLMVTQQNTGIIRVVRKIYEQGGIPAFFRGNLADVIRAVPSSAVRFCAFELYKTRLPACLAAVGVHALAATSLLAGGFAGMTSMALLYPLETVRTQMAANGALQGISLIAFSQSLFNSAGVAGFYRGLPASLISVMPFFAVRFGAYDMLKRWHVKIAGGTEMPSQFGAAYGFASAIMATACTFPMEMVRRRAMIGTASSNYFKVFPAIVKAEGFRGLYKGYGVNVLKVAPSSAVTFYVYEAVRGMLDDFVDQENKETQVNETAAELAGN